MERSYLSWWVSGAAPAGVGALSPLPEVTLPALRHHRYRLTDEDGGWSAASPAVPAQMQLSGGAQPVWLRFPLFLFFLPTFFFSSCFYSRKEGPVLHLTTPDPPTAACLPGRAVRWRERLSLWSECVTTVRSGTGLRPRL